MANTDVTAPTNARAITPAGWEKNRRKVATVDILRGQLVKYENGGARLVAVGELEADGICVKDCPAGFMCDVGVDGEMDGFSGLTDGAPLYPSETNAGMIQTAARAGALIRIKAISTTRISYVFV